MTCDNANPTASRTGVGSKYYVIFFLAGLPALIYQVAWQRVLTLYFGVDLYSTSVTVSAFMLGLGFGSLFGGRLADRTKRPAVIYAGIELLIGCFGLASPWLFSFVGEAFAGSSLFTIIPVNFALLLLPATLMGITLPLMCRIVNVSPSDIGKHLSWLYGVNTMGAAFGALFAAYILLGILGIDGTSYLAAGVNFSLAIATLVIFRLSRRSDSVADDRQTSEVISEVTPEVSYFSRYDLLLLSFMSGFIGLGYEIAWYRVLGCILHGTVYVFGTILSIYLLGIAAGALASRKRVDQQGAAQRFALCQIAIALYTLFLFIVVGHFSWLPGLRHIIAASTYTTFHPAPELFSGEVSLSSLYSLLDIPLWTFLIIGPPAFLMGYGFPNLMRAASQSVETLGRSVGSVYFANILGSTIGTLAIGFLCIHHYGTERTFLMLVCLGILPAIIVVLRMSQTKTISENTRTQFRIAMLGIAAMLVVSLVYFPGPGQIIRAIHYADFDQVEVVAVAEDRTGVVLLKNQQKVITFPEEKRAIGSYRLYIDGANHGGISLGECSPDQAVRWALAAHQCPKRVLCIGLGNGSMCVSAVNWPQVEELVVVELNSALTSVLLHTANGVNVLQSPKTKLIQDDGRHWLLANSDEKFDLVMMFPLHAAHAHSGNLFSLEFFDLVKSHLSQEGLFFFHSVDCHSTAKTLATVFPHVLRANGTAYLAGQQKFVFALEQLDWTAEKLRTYVEADRKTILANTMDVPLNRDLKPNAEFYLTYAYRDWLSPRHSRQAYRSQVTRR